jgi:hypothetical protein
MDGISKRVRICVQALTGAPPNSLIGWTDVEMPFCNGVKQPENIPDVFCQLAELLLTLSQGNFYLLTLYNFSH